MVVETSSMAMSAFVTWDRIQIKSLANTMDRGIWMGIPT